MNLEYDPYYIIKDINFEFKMNGQRFCYRTIVDVRASKLMIKQSILDIFGVYPKKVNILNGLTKRKKNSEPKRKKIALINMEKRLPFEQHISKFVDVMNLEDKKEINILEENSEEEEK